jgi:hypothetical protein
VVPLRRFSVKRLAINEIDVVGAVHTFSLRRASLKGRLGRFGGGTAGATDESAIDAAAAYVGGAEVGVVVDT